LIAYQTPEPNDPVTLYQGTFRLGNKKALSIQVQGSISLDWLPQPRLLFAHKAYEPDVSTAELLRNKIEVVDIDGHLICQTGLGVSLRSREEGFELSIQLDRVEKKIDSLVDRVFFHVVNFDGFNRRGSYGGTSGISGKVIVGGGWRLDLRRLGMNYRHLGETGGFALTHWGILEKEDGTTFSTDQATDILDALYFFLSFAAGHWCWPCLYIGIKDDGLRWFRCDSPKGLEPIGGWHRSLFTTTDVAVDATFQGFVNFWDDVALRKPIQTAITWYLEANRAKSGESAIVAGQTALELIAWVEVVERQKVLSPEGFDKLPAADKLKLLLKLLNISVAFPKTAAALKSYSSDSARQWEDGPRSIAELRNSIVHPKRRARFYDAPEKIQEQTRELTLWYLSSALLRLFGYNKEIPAS
jgi:hypothetical protein